MAMSTDELLAIVDQLGPFAVEARRLAELDPTRERWCAVDQLREAAAHLRSAAAWHERAELNAARRLPA